MPIVGARARGILASCECGDLLAWAILAGFFGWGEESPWG